MDPTTSKTRLRLSLERAAAGGAPSIGQWLEFPGYTLARTVASLPGVDWVLIDCEHGNIDDAAMYHSVAAVVAAGASPIVRIAGSENWMVKRALDAGAQVARFAHYPSKDFPSATRGQGGLFAPPNFSLDPKSYALTANALITIIVQIETRTGVTNAAAIASRPGIDALFIGPNDLASSMGHFAFDHAQIPEVQEAGKTVLAAAKKAGKFAGYFSLGAEDAARRVREGWEFVNCGADLVAITSWMGAEMGRLRGLVEGMGSA
ncbi:hypothetical protein M409DRAFT_64265 [Zasmidium cellare ATCC 36951]|uniref:HpcH/HpaI aldolase/citrate lyase domain-containing protein n=1 Tax=Zasmidium cellare ATCC 36951 TaxID=1080233 RepID=A0A6A6CXQ3_ZASCE|nr:uncharacterized protein M409DRAFT_64265 [Zasmidium cellare ATCC 36951]KAF2170579.1 hypothetical protein M409DRAFT_64265 [Zasmidium cellare ATCC 36951]